MPNPLSSVCALLSLTVFASAQGVPTEVQMPGTQPGQVTGTNTSEFCNNCHGNYSVQVEPWRNWLGSAMAHATRDPLFWAATAVAEQDFPGAGDLCLRCHTPLGWLAGRSTPTDGSALITDDFDGVSCHLCHRLTDPDRSEHLGVQTAPFVANDGGAPPEAYLGSAMYVAWAGNHRLGPYANTSSPHASLQSRFHRSSDLCGTCHDVSNPVVGDLAHNNGALAPLAAGTFSGVPGSPVDGKAAFNNFPFQYGIVERTFSEHRSTPLSDTRVSAYATLPADLKAGAIARARADAIVSTPTGDYVDGTPRTFTCQTCHMSPTQGKGAGQSQAPVRADLPHHDLTGGNDWISDAIQWLDGQGRLLGGGGLTATKLAAMDTGEQRARSNLANAASLRVEGDTVVVTNLTGHKLLSGYPDGRRMWLRVRWFDAQNGLVREDGAYGPIAVQHNGQARVVETLLDLHDVHSKIYEAEFGLTQVWAQQLLALGHSPALALSYDRLSGQPTVTLGQLGASGPGATAATFHFALANAPLSDNRIPPWRMNHDEALARSVLPVPPDQYGDPGPGGEYEHFDRVALDPPAGAERAEIELLYQATSWEYVQFLSLANHGTVAHLASAGQDLLDAWTATGMAAPRPMASASWQPSAPQRYCTAKVNSQGCTPRMTWSGAPSASGATAFSVGAVDVLNRRPGLLFYGTNGAAAFPYQGGWRCVATPLARTPNQDSGGNPTGNDCSGVYAYDFAARIASGVDPALVSGRTVWAQYWTRDPQASFTTGLSDGLTFTIRP